MLKKASAALGVTAFLLACAPAWAGAPLSWTSIQPISPGGSPYAPGCSGSTTGTLYPGTEVEPWVATNPADDGNSIAVWQQDRYSNGGSNGLRAAYSVNGQWTAPVDQPAFSPCAGGPRTPGGDERAPHPRGDLYTPG